MSEFHSYVWQKSIGLRARVRRSIGKAISTTTLRSCSVWSLHLQTNVSQYGVILYITIFNLCLVPWYILIQFYLVHRPVHWTARFSFHLYIAWGVSNYWNLNLANNILNRNIPPSYIGPYGSIKYYIEVAFDEPGIVEPHRVLLKHDIHVEASIEQNIMVISFKNFKCIQIWFYKKLNRIT